MSVDLDVSIKLRPYVPRLLIQWLSEAPGTTLRALDGTVVFVDISGFTKMSERLARHGKVGAEEVTDVLGAVFTRLLSVAYGNGGGLIKFGGDALLLFFSGEDHQVRGARAAVGMRRMLREVGKIQSSVGLITLRMSVGVHSGTFHFFLVGDSHRELIVTGPAASEIVDMEGTASAGEIVVSRATAAALPANVLGAPKGDGFMLKREPAGLSLEQVDQETPVEGVDLFGCVPVAIREHLLAGVLDAEHRQVTVAFIHYDGIDAMVNEMGAEYVTFGLDQLVTIAQSAADKHSVTFLGTDIDHDGGKIILVAGSPRAVGEDEERMLLTVRMIMDSEPAIPIRIGVNKGPVFAGDIGPVYRRTFTVMGDAVNLAARVMAKAEPGQVLATSSVLDASTIDFELDALEPFMVKGKKYPVTAFAVGKILGSNVSPESDNSLPLVGREREVAAIELALAGARESRGGVLEIVGPAGIGKTRLLQELRERAAGFRFVQAACDLYGRSTPYAPFRTIFLQLLETAPEAGDSQITERLRERVETLAPELLPWLPLLAVPLGIELPPTPEVAELGADFRKARLEQASEEFFTALLTQPTLLTIEDVHWMDSASRELLERLADAVPTRPWLIVTPRRPEATGFVASESPSTVSLSLEPLTESAAELLLELATEDAPLRPDDLAMLAERSSGNPLFARELLAAVRTSGSIDDLPESIESLVGVQIDRLRSADRKILRGAAVLGMTFSEQLANELLIEGEGHIDPGTWERLGEFLTQDEPSLRRFRHALMHDAAYNGLPFRTRRELHAQAGDLIVRTAPGEPEEFAELLSLHFFNAQAYGDALRFSRVAAGQAAEKYANAEAITFFKRAIDAARQLGESGEQRGSLLESLGDVYWRMSSFSDAAAAFAQARVAAPRSPADEARFFLKEARIPYRDGRLSQAVRKLKRGIRCLGDASGDDDVVVRVSITAQLAVIRGEQGQYAESERLAREAIRDAPTVAEKEALAIAYCALDYVFLQQGRSEEDVLPLALKLHEERGDLYQQAEVEGQMAINDALAGRWPGATSHFERSRELKLRVGDAEGAALATANLGEVFLDQGKLVEAEANLREALRVFRGVGSGTTLGATIGVLARVASAAGRLDEAIELFEQAADIFKVIGDQGQALGIAAGVAELHLRRGDPDSALAGARDALRKGEALGGISPQAPSLHRVIGLALAAKGEPREARAALEDSLVTARSRGAENEVSLTLEAMAEVFPDDPLAARWLEEAAQV